MRPLDDFHFDAAVRSPYEISPEGIIDPKTPGVPVVLMRDLAADDKPREKALKYGMDALNNAEVLALLLGSGTTGKSVLDLAREILRDNGDSPSQLARISIAELIRKYKGVGQAKAVLLAAAMTFGHRCAIEDARKRFQASSAQSVFDYMRPRLENLPHEEFWVLHLNQANRLIFEERLSKGGLAFTAVDIKLLAKSAIDHLACGIILIHNHPSGTLSPSAQDDNLTRRIVEIAKVCDIEVLDHVIITHSGYYSYADQSRL